jgi:hypothetical protein
VTRNPCVFVVGCPRSGTTLLQRMLDHHPSLAVANDTHFIPRALEKAGRVENPRLTPDLVDAVRHYRRFHRLGLDAAAVGRAAAHSETYAAFVAALYSEFAHVAGKPLGGEKTPDYVRRLPLLHALFPWARTIHIFRDGRDTALSILDWAREDKGPGRFRLWRTQPVAVCALWWDALVRCGRRDGLDLGAGRYREVRYEHLVANPRDTMADLLRFLDLPFAPETVTFYEGKTRLDPRLSAKRAWLPPTPGLRDWRAHMPDQDVELFEALAGDLLSSLGYERAFPTIAESTRTLAADHRRRFELELAERRTRPRDRAARHA